MSKPTYKCEYQAPDGLYCPRSADLEGYRVEDDTADGLDTYAAYSCLKHASEVLDGLDHYCLACGSYTSPDEPDYVNHAKCTTGESDASADYEVTP